MSPADILAAFHLSPPPAQAQIDRLLGAGVAPLALARDPDEYGYTVAVERVVFDGNRFDFARDLDDTGAAMALLIAARDEAGDITDIVATRPSAGQIASWLGRVGLLGEQNLWAPRLGSDAITIHPDVISWLADERRGVVVVDADKAKRLLADAGPLLAASIEHGCALRTALTIPAPPIRVALNPSSLRRAA